MNKKSYQWKWGSALITVGVEGQKEVKRSPWESRVLWEWYRLQGTCWRDSTSLSDFPIGKARKNWYSSSNQAKHKGIVNMCQPPTPHPWKYPPRELGWKTGSQIVHCCLHFLLLLQFPVRRSHFISKFPVLSAQCDQEEDDPRVQIPLTSQSSHRHVH